MKATSALPISSLRSAQEPSFSEIVADAKKGLSNAIDLILIHNEHNVRGNQPRSTLNPLILMLAVAAWERFIADTCLLANDAFEGAGLGQSPPGRAFFSSRGAINVLGALTSQRLPNGFTVKVFDSWVGKYPTNARTVHGLEVAEYVNDAIKHRNGVAHRSLPHAYSDARFSSDARSHTVQAGWARGAAATIVQILDQSIVAISREAGFAKVHRLPRAWFIPQARILRGVKTPGALWGEHELVQEH